jgi:hypothetical protein
MKNILRLGVLMALCASINSNVMAKKKCDSNCTSNCITQGAGGGSFKIGNSNYSTIGDCRVTRCGCKD